MSKKKVQEDDWGVSFEEDTLQPEEDLSLDGFNSVPERKSLTPGKIVGSIFVALLFLIVIFIGTLVLYKKLFTYPKQMEVVYETTGQYCVDNWVASIKDLCPDRESSYIHQEVEYANGSDEKIEFYKKMLGTISYDSYEVVAKNVYGNDMIDSETDEVVYIKSYIEPEEVVAFSYIDYDAIDMSEHQAEIKKLIKDNNLSYGEVDYENKLVLLYIKFMLGLKDDQIPIKTIDRVPNMIMGVDGSYMMSDAEDIYLDKLLFSSNEFYASMDRFSLMVANLCGANKSLITTSEYKIWFAKDSEEKAATVRPSQYLYKQCCVKTWCGTYYLFNEYVPSGNEVIIAEIGDGTFANPAGYHTDIVTSVFYNEYDELGNVVNYKEYPIRVSLIDFGVSQDAIDFFETKDDRNRGINIFTSTQYCYAIFEITNLSDETLVIDENMGICDRNGNMQARTGLQYGLQSSVTLAPDETGYIETWQSSTELHRKYIVWGNDFMRRAEPVWFRLLAGDLENPDEFKGVYQLPK